MRRPAALLATVFLLGGLSCSAREPLPSDLAAQVPAGDTGAVRAREWSPELPDGLLELAGGRVWARYEPGALDRASRVQWRLDPSLLRFERLTRRPQAILVTVVGRDRWRVFAGAEPYGFPVRREPGQFLVAAEADGELVSEVERFLGGPLPLLEGEPLRGTREEVGALAVLDVLLQIDVCLDFVERAGPRTDEPWGVGLLAQWLARLAFEEEGAGRISEVALLLDRIATGLSPPEPRSLADYRPETPWRERAWFEARLLRGADLLWVEEGNRGSERRFYRWFERGKPVRTTDLEHQYPSLQGWRRQHLPGS